MLLKPVRPPGSGHASVPSSRPGLCLIPARWQLLTPVGAHQHRNPAARDTSTVVTVPLTAEAGVDPSTAVITPTGNEAGIDVTGASVSSRQTSESSTLLVPAQPEAERVVLHPTEADCTNEYECTNATGQVAEVADPAFRNDSVKVSLPTASAAQPVSNSKHEANAAPADGGMSVSGAASSSCVADAAVADQSTYATVPVKGVSVHEPPQDSGTSASTTGQSSKAHASVCNLDSSRPAMHASLSAPAAAGTTVALHSAAGPAGTETAPQPQSPQLAQSGRSTAQLEHESQPGPFVPSPPLASSRSSGPTVPSSSAGNSPSQSAGTTLQTEVYSVSAVNMPQPLSQAEQHAATGTPSAVQPPAAQPQAMLNDAPAATAQASAAAARPSSVQGSVQPPPSSQAAAMSPQGPAKLSSAASTASSSAAAAAAAAAAGTQAALVAMTVRPPPQQLLAAGKQPQVAQGQAQQPGLSQQGVSAPTSPSSSPSSSQSQSVAQPSSPVQQAASSQQPQSPQQQQPQSPTPQSPPAAATSPQQAVSPSQSQSQQALPPPQHHDTMPPITAASSGFQLKPIHLVMFTALFIGAAVFATITLQFTSELEPAVAVQTVVRRVLKSAAFRQLCVIATAILIVRFGLNSLLKTLSRFSASPVQWEKSKLFYVLREVYQPLELLLFIAAVCTLGEAFVPQLIAVPKSTVAAVSRSILSVSFIFGTASVVFNLKSRFCKEAAWQSEMAGDITSQRRWEAYDKLGTFVIYAVTFVLGIQALGLEVTSVLAIGGIGGLAIGLAGREICENILNGFLIMSTSPFEVGDEVHFFHPSKVVEGMVLDIGWYRTTIRSYEREVFVVPNSVFSKNIVLNITRKNREWRFFETVTVRVQDVHKVNNIVKDIRNIVRNDSRIITKLHRRIFLDKITHEDCRIYVSFYVEAASREAFMSVKQDLLLAFVDCVERNDAKLAVPRTTLDMEPELMHTAGMALSAASVMAAKAYEQGTANAAAAMRALPGPSSTSGGNSNTITAEATTVTVPSSPTKVPSVVVVPSTTATTEPAVPKERRDRDRDGGGGSGVSGGGSGVTSNVVAAAGMGATPVQQQQRGQGDERAQSQQKPQTGADASASGSNKGGRSSMGDGGSSSGGARGGGGGALRGAVSAATLAVLSASSDPRVPLELIITASFDDMTV